MINLTDLVLAATLSAGGSPGKAMLEMRATLGDSGHSFELKGTSAYYVDQLRVKKKV